MILTKGAAKDKWKPADAQDPPAAEAPVKPAK
jgi:hypothetical protein